VSIQFRYFSKYSILARFSLLALMAGGSIMQSAVAQSAGQLAARSALPSATDAFDSWTADASNRGPFSQTGGAPLRDDPQVDRGLSTPQVGGEATSVTGLREMDASPATMRARETQPVSADELRHPLTGKALRLIRKAESLIRAGDHAGAIQELRRDLGNSAAAPFAHSLLGQEYIRSLQFSEAVPELECAVEMLPSNVPDHANLGYALLMTNQLDAAETQLARALELQPKNLQTHLVMGMLRFKQGSAHDRETREHLELAAREIPGAHLLLAKFYSRAGRTEDATREFQVYLTMTGAADADALRMWLNAGN
jgi:tetratricopeptide (TPR) repeat protein